MNIWEIVTRLEGMAFRRKAIVDKLHALKGPIIDHALKIIAYRIRKVGGPRDGAGLIRGRIESLSHRQI